jgi:hypothetical protein
VGRLTELVVARRAELERWLCAVALLAPAAAVVAGVGHQAMTGTVAGLRFLALYVAPMFLAAPLWARQRLAGLEQRPASVRAVDGGVLVLSLARFVAGGVLPFSGHMLFLTYSGLTVRARGYRWLVGLLLLETTVFKLWLWRDPQSWSLGLGLGLAAGLAALGRGSRPST